MRENAGMATVERGFELLKRGELDAAEAELSQVAKPSASALHGLGLIAERRGQRAQALKLLAEAAALSPGDPELACDRAMLLLEAGDETAAQNALQGAARSDPGHPRLNLHLAMAYAKESPEKARGFAAHALERGQGEVQDQARALYAALAQISG